MMITYPSRQHNRCIVGLQFITPTFYFPPVDPCSRSHSSIRPVDSTMDDGDHSASNSPGSSDLSWCALISLEDREQSTDLPPSSLGTSQPEGDTLSLTHFERVAVNTIRFNIRTGRISKVLMALRFERLRLHDKRHNINVFRQLL